MQEQNGGQGQEQDTGAALSRRNITARGNRHVALAFGHLRCVRSPPQPRRAAGTLMNEVSLSTCFIFLRRARSAVSLMPFTLHASCSKHVPFDYLDRLQLAGIQAELLPFAASAGPAQPAAMAARRSVLTAPQRTCLHSVGPVYW